MSGNLMVQLVWAVRGEELPEGQHPKDDLGLDCFQAGPVNEDGDMEGFCGEAICEELEPMTEYYHTSVSFEEFEAARERLKKKLEELGIEAEPKLFMLHSID